MKILVLSDSHGCLASMRQAITIEHPDCIIHLGDHSSDAERMKNEFPMLPIAVVKGNCDYCDCETRDQLILTYDWVKIFAVHGHMYGVKTGLLRLFMAAKEKAVHVALFGHTHCAYCEMKDDLWLMNPGSCGRNGQQTYGIIEIVDTSVSCCVKSLNERVEYHDSCN